MEEMLYREHQGILLSCFQTEEADHQERRNMKTAKQWNDELNEKYLGDNTPGEDEIRRIQAGALRSAAAMNYTFFHPAVCLCDVCASKRRILLEAIMLDADYHHEN